MSRERATFGIWLALAPALIIVGLLVGVSLVYGVAQSLGLLAIIGTSQLSLDAYRDLWLGIGRPGASLGPHWVSRSG